MSKKMLIDASHVEETRVAVMDGDRLEDFDFESKVKKSYKSNIYLAKVTRVEPSLQACFVNYGGNRHGFLPFSEIHPDYYRIPIEDREKLMAEQEELAKKIAARAEESEDEDDDELEENLSKLLDEEENASSDDKSNGNAKSDDSDDAEDEDDSSSDEESEDDSDSKSKKGKSKARKKTAAKKTSKKSDDEISEDLDEDADDADNDSDDDSDDEDDTDDSSDDNDDQNNDSSGNDNNNKKGGRSRGRRRYRGRRGGRGRSRGRHNNKGKGSNKSVNTVGGDDLEADPSFLLWKRMRRSYKIQEVIKRGQIMLVQCQKEERGNKGAAMTTYITLPGRYGVLMPNSPRGGGISRKIGWGDRKKLKDVLSEVTIPKGMSVILRTAAVSRTKAEIKRDLDYLYKLWDSIRELTLKSNAPAEVYEEGNLIKRAVRDLYTREVDEIWVEGEDGYKEAKEIMKLMIPSHAKRVKKYDDNTMPLFHRYHVETQIDEIYDSQVTLKSGGYLVIHPTEALVSIDVNSGRATKGRHIEETALRTNLETADEVARQLRLRDLGGLVVIDFIDMEDYRNNRDVEKRLNDALSRDRARVQVGRISNFGLLELSRQRLRPSLTETHFRACTHCDGAGVVRTEATAALRILRAIEEEGIKGRTAELQVEAPTEIGLYILNNKRDMLKGIEDRYGFKVFVNLNDDYSVSDFEFERIEGKSRNSNSGGNSGNDNKSSGNDNASSDKDDKDSATDNNASDNKSDDNKDSKKSSSKGGRGRGRGRSKSNKPKDNSGGNSNAKDNNQNDEKSAPESKPESNDDQSKSDDKADVKEDKKPSKSSSKKPTSKAKKKDTASSDNDDTDKKSGSSDAKKDAPQDKNEGTKETKVKDYETVNKAPEKPKKGWWNKVADKVKSSE